MVMILMGIRFNDSTDRIQINASSIFEGLFLVEANPLDNTLHFLFRPPYLV
jgi:hypothetical protein